MWGEPSNFSLPGPACREAGRESPEEITILNRSTSQNKLNIVTFPGLAMNCIQAVSVSDSRYSLSRVILILLLSAAKFILWIPACPARIVFSFSSKVKISVYIGGLPVSFFRISKATAAPTSASILTTAFSNREGTYKQGLRPNTRCNSSSRSCRAKASRLNSSTTFAKPKEARADLNNALSLTPQIL